jgi:tetratricopeptide (TPR) repeat protein
MKNNFIPAISITAFLFFAVTIGFTLSFAQQSTQAPTVVTNASIRDLDQKLSDLQRKTLKLEVTQTHLIESLRSSNDQSKYLLTAFGAFIGLLVAIQGLATFAQLRRERKRDEWQTLRENKRDGIENTGVKQVTEIMSVVKDTIESRLDAEKQAREEAQRAHEQLEKVLGQIKSLGQFFEKYQTNIQKARLTIENTASQWAQSVSRHDFRRMINELNGFARQFDTFKTDYEALEEEPHPDFSARVLYIRGIAAHYANRPEIAKEYLTQVAGFQQHETGETEIAYNRRVANAFYYIGITESNFGNHRDAIAFFDNANKRDIQGSDFLTQVVTAEAYVMVDDYEKAKQFVKGVEDGLDKIERTEGRLRNFHLRLRSRGALIRANIAIIARDTEWHDEVQHLLGPVHNADPQYYYATATLAQSYADQKNLQDAQRLFVEAYEAIERSGDFLTVTEVRSQILLRMVAAICCKHGLKDEKRSEENLDRADDLRGSLPKIGPQVCTVFSTLSKRNENSDTVHYHVELIRKGNVLLEPRR